VVAQGAIHGDAVGPQQLKVGVDGFPFGVEVAEGDDVAQDKEGSGPAGVYVAENELCGLFVMVMPADELFDKEAALCVAGEIDGWPGGLGCDLQGGAKEEQGRQAGVNGGSGGDVAVVCQVVKR